MNRQTKVDLLKNILIGKESIKSLVRSIPGETIDISFKRINEITRDELINIGGDSWPESAMLGTELFRCIDNDKVYNYEQIVSLYEKDNRLLIWHDLNESDFQFIGIAGISIQGVLKNDFDALAEISVKE